MINLLGVMIISLGLLTATGVLCASAAFILKRAGTNEHLIAMTNVIIVFLVTLSIAAAWLLSA